MPAETAEQPAFRAAWHYRYVVLGRPPNCGLHLGSVSRTDKPQYGFLPFGRVTSRSDSSRTSRDHAYGVAYPRSELLKRILHVAK
jgi:hypothetical protein